jgi:hypothetical protein
MIPTLPSLDYVATDRRAIVVPRYLCDENDS